ncbi:MAG: hypothetical protein XU12_C0001G0139 [Deltaproteobacteria bacterium CSP1-8]|nr:MAG: hypothetical protein XU12_C0001G0139 [Deltaproteobacteria bacterium CSP1-8]
MEPLTWFHRVGYTGIAACLLWPRMGVHAVGVAGLILFVLLEKALHKRRTVRARRE